MLTVAIAAAGSVGAVARFGLDRAIHARFGRAFPYALLVVNPVGSFVLAVTVGAAAAGHGLSPDTTAVIGTGLCGGFTTFSTFSHDTYRLARQQSATAAALNVGLSLVLGMAAAALGLALTA